MQSFFFLLSAYQFVNFKGQSLHWIMYVNHAIYHLAWPRELASRTNSSLTSQYEFSCIKGETVKKYKVVVCLYVNGLFRVKKLWDQTEDMSQKRRANKNSQTQDGSTKKRGGGWRHKIESSTCLHTMYNK